MKQSPSCLQKWLPLALLVAAGGCASSAANLVPAASANDVMGLKDAASATQSNVQVVVQASGWPGDAKITQRVTPVRVVIHNMGQVPLSVRYRDFKLVGSQGQVYHAIPPLKTQGAVPLRAEAFEPSFGYSDFAVAPGYAYAYPDFDVWSGPFDNDAAYFDEYYPYWSRAILPTPDMLSWALPAGVVKAGGEVDGYVFFPHLDKQVDRVRFDTTLSDPQDGKQVMSATIPFDVKH